MNPDKRVPKYRLIADAIHREMLAARQRGVPFSKTQLELADEFGVNRQTVRHALDWLELHRMAPDPAPVPEVAGEEDLSGALPKIGFPLWVHSLESLNVAGIENRLNFAQHISMELANRGYQLDIQCIGPHRAPDRQKIARLKEEWRGLFLEPHIGDNALYEDHPFASMRERTVVIGTLQDTRYNSVCPDYYAAAKLAMEELIRCGARRILYTGPQDETASYLFVRIAGAEKGMEEYPGLEMLHTLEGSSAEKAFSVVKRFFMEGGQCDAVLACTSYAGSGAIRAMADLGIRVPEDVQLIAIGQTNMSAYMVPRPTLISTDYGRLGRQAAAMMDALLRPGSQPQPNILIPMHLVKGETTRDAVSSPKTAATVVSRGAAAPVR